MQNNCNGLKERERERERELRSLDDDYDRRRQRSCGCDEPPSCRAGPEGGVVSRRLIRGGFLGTGRGGRRRVLGPVLGLLGSGGGRGGGVDDLSELEQLPGLEHLVDGVDGVGVLIDESRGDGGSDDAGLQRDVRAVGLHGVVEVLVGAVGGEGVDDAVVGLEELRGVVHRHAVVEKEGGLAVGGEVLVLGSERLDGSVVGAEDGEPAVEVVLEDLEDVRAGEQQVGEGLAALLSHERGEVDRGGGRHGGLRLGGAKDGAHLQHGNVVGHLLHGLDEGDRRCATGVLGGKGDLAGAVVGNVDVAGGSGGVAGGLEDGGGQGGAASELVELLGAVIVSEDVEGEDVAECEDGEVLGEEDGHARVVDRKHGDGEAAVDLGRQVGDGKVVVESGELRVRRQNLGYVVALRHRGAGGRQQQEKRSGEKRKNSPHCEC
ncbi:unnamed protein product [Musa banksii]